MFDLLILFISCVLIFRYLNTSIKKKPYTTPPGPASYPVVGCTLGLLKVKKGEDLLKLFQNYAVPNNYIFFGSVLYFGNFGGIARPEHVQALLTNRAGLHKAKLIYTRLKLVGDSMLSGRVQMWQQRRKIIAPAFHQLSVKNYFSKFSHLTHNIFCSMLADNHSAKGYFNVEDVISVHMLRGVTETLFNIDTTNTDSSHFLKAIHTVERIVDRLSENVIKELVYKGTETDDDRQIRSFVAWLVDTYEQQRTRRQEKDETSPETGLLENMRNLPRQALLNDLEGALLAAYDTVSISTSYFSVLLALHPLIQDKIYEELKNIFGDSDRPATEEDLKKMVYLEASMRDSMRLFSPVPFIARKTSQDLKLDDEYTIPAGTIVFVLIYLLHRNPSVWKNPDVFNPDNFSPENSQKMNPYSFIPFSVGIRSCLGYKLAFMMMKLTMSAMIRKYHLETDMKMSELKVDRLFTLRASHLRIRLRERSE